jgi:HAD superfamily hydrolase (TIGR01662 family)
MYDTLMQVPLGEKIKAARISAQLTQKLLAEKLKCTEVMVSRYELSAVPVSIEKLQKISSIVGKPLSYFFEDRKTEKLETKRSGVKKAFVFDLDDTLVDGRNFCGETIARAITAQVPSANFELICQIHDSIKGMSIEDLYLTILKELDLKVDVKKLLEYDRVIQQENINKMKLFDGVIEMLEYLKSKGKKLYICTNRPKVLLDKVLTENKIDFYFDEVISCADAGYKKPNPYCLLDIIRRSELDSDQFIYFGDSEIDSQFAKSAGIEHIIFDQYLNNNNLFTKLVNMFLEQ